MNSVPLIFSRVTGLGVSILGAFLAVIGIVDWGLCLVGLGILGVSFVSRLGASEESAPAVFAKSGTATPAR